MPYVLIARDIPPGQPPKGMEVHPARCIFCARVLRHVNDGGAGLIANGVVDGVARQYLYCNEGPCSVTSAPWIWRCGCDGDYVENVGDHCGGCRRHRRLARSYKSVVCPLCDCHYDVNDRGGIGRDDACPDCAETLYRPIPYDVPLLSVGTSRKALCQSLLEAAEEHGLESEGGGDSLG